MMQEPLNILYVGHAQGFDNANKYYMIPQKLINGFTRNGHNAYIFNDRDYARATNIFKSSKIGIPATNAKLLQICTDFAPDLIVLGHCKHISNDTLGEIRSKLPDVRIIYRNVDPLHSKQNLRDINQRVGVVDGIFITTAGDAIKQFEHKNTFVSYMPNPVDRSIETARAFEKDGTYDLFFAGSFLRDQYDQRKDILHDLQNDLGDLKLGFFGSDTGTEKVFGKCYMDLLADSKMGLSLNKTSDYYLYASDRLSQYLGQGLLVFIDKDPQFQDLFEDDEMVFYDNYDDLTDKIRFYADHDDERRSIAKKGWEKAHDIFDCNVITRYMIEKTFNLPFSQMYSWKDL